MRATYKRRRDVMVESFAKAGWQVPVPTASMFAWAQIPEKFRAMGSLEFSKLLVEKADVAVAPGIGFGEHGDDYVRIALGGKRAAHPPGRPQHPQVLRQRRPHASQRGAPIGTDKVGFPVSCLASG